MIGLAIDGHQVLGPRKQDGELWTPDDLDLCHGINLADGTYAYVSTVFEPYTVGCWGPSSSAIYLSTITAVYISLLL